MKKRILSAMLTLAMVLSVFAGISILTNAELRTVMNAAVYHGETRISSTAKYSVNTYGKGKSDTLLELCKALMAYSDTALTFFSNQ